MKILPSCRLCFVFATLDSIENYPYQCVLSVNIICVRMSFGKKYSSTDYSILECILHYPIAYFLGHNEFNG